MDTNCLKQLRLLEFALLHGSGSRKAAGAVVWFSETTHIALEALLSSTTSGPRLAGVRQRQHSTMHIVDANLYKGHCGLKPRLILI